MPTYRCYFLDSQDHIKAATDLEADTLAASIDTALALLEAHPEHHALEIWQGARRLYPVISEQTARSRFVETEAVRSAPAV